MNQIVWIRHAEKQYANHKGPVGCKQHDSPIQNNESENERIKLRTLSLIDHYGIPDTIVYSPFLRARQTMNKIHSIIKEYSDKPIEFLCDPDIGEFLGFQKPKGGLADVEATTSTYYPNKKVYLGESIDELKTRVYKHLNKIKNKSGIIWVITHGFVIKHISETLKDMFDSEVKEIVAIGTLGCMNYQFSLDDK
jgi:broad specificity phosphatase PhoE